MADFEDGNLMTLVINEINDSVLTLPDAIAVSVSRKLLGAFRAGIGAQRLNSLNDLSTVDFCA